MRIFNGRKLPSALLLASAFVALAASPLLASSPGTQVVGSEGAVLRVLSGSYGELFAGGTETSPENQVLALDVMRGAASQRVLVPGTESVFEEFSPSLVHDSRAEVTWLLWEGLHNGVHPLLYLRSFDESGWGELIELSGSPFSRKGHPQLVVTRDRSTEAAADGSPIEVERAILHVFWWEEQGTEMRERYAPLVLEGGRFIGAHPVIDLSERYAPGSAAVPLSAVGDLLRVQPGPSAGSVLAGFVEHDAGQVVSLEIEAVPRALSRLAENITDFVRDQQSSVTLEALANLVRERLAQIGGEIHPATLDYLEQSVASLIVSSDPALVVSEGMESLGRKAGMHILIIGARQTVEITEQAQDEILTVSRFSGEKPWHHLRLSKISSRPYPESVGAEAQLFLSRNGREACLAWTADSKVYYRESAGAGWADAQEITLGESLDLETVMAIIAQRTLDR